jgi:hypothetical protein
MSTKVVTGTVRGSYVHIFNPKDSKGEEPKFSMALLIPKTDTKTVGELQAAIDKEIQMKWAGTIPAKLNTPLHDGDGAKPGSGDAYGEECRGCYVLNVSSKDAPGIVDGAKKPITDPTKVSSGDYFRVSLGAFAYDTAGRKGVSFALRNVQWVRKGEPLGKTCAGDDFEVIADDDEEDFLK